MVYCGTNYGLESWRSGNMPSTAVVVVTAAAAALCATAVSLFSWRKVKKENVLLQAQLAEISRLRQQDRDGRTRVERELRALRSKNLDDEGWPMKPIGYIESCFRERNGTPRQACLVPDARAVLKIRPDLNPKAISDGIAEFSHVWIVVRYHFIYAQAENSQFIFHENTNAARHARLREDVPAAASPPIKVKIRPPRHNAKVGVLATRTPHRPNPIGLSLARLERVDGDAVLHLSGIDLVDGTPVLDVKPFIPYVP